MIRMDLVLTGCMIFALLFLSMDFGVSGHEEKINGASLVSPRNPVERDQFVPLLETGSNWVAIIPYAFTPGNSQVLFNHDRQWWGERTDGVSELILLSKQMGLKVMLKPHLWIRGQGWAGEFELGSDKEWTEWEQNYTDYILHFASMADSLHVEMFCVGTELRKSVVARPEFWNTLIGKVRNRYRGKVTYAANWDNYQYVNFWDQLDYIGVDAYFPVSQSDNPDIAELKKGWEQTRSQLKSFSVKHGKPILFTEYGYQSISGTAGNHWELDKKNLNLEAQSDAYEALFQVFWDENWIAGGFFWKWYFGAQAGGLENADFTPQGKPAMEIVKSRYSR